MIPEHWPSQPEEGENSDADSGRSEYGDEDIAEEVSKNIRKYRLPEDEIIRTFAMGFKAGEKVIWNNHIATVSEMPKRHVRNGEVPIEWQVRDGDEVFIHRANIPADDLMHAEK